MKKTTLTLALVALSIFSFTSCKKEYHCECTYNNALMKNVDLGTQTKDYASTLCNSYDTTVPGEKWLCTLY
jgi:hypothetical protein